MNKTPVRKTRASLGAAGGGSAMKSVDKKSNPWTLSKKTASSPDQLVDRTISPSKKAPEPVVISMVESDEDDAVEVMREVPLSNPESWVWKGREEEKVAVVVETRQDLLEEAGGKVEFKRYSSDEDSEDELVGSMRRANAGLSKYSLPLHPASASKMNRKNGKQPTNNRSITGFFGKAPSATGSSSPLRSVPKQVNKKVQQRKQEKSASPSGSDVEAPIVIESDSDLENEDPATSRSRRRAAAKAKKGLKKIGEYFSDRDEDLDEVSEYGSVEGDDDFSDQEEETVTEDTSALDDTDDMEASEDEAGSSPAPGSKRKRSPKALPKAKRSKTSDASLDEESDVDVDVDDDGEIIEKPKSKKATKNAKNITDMVETFEYKIGIDERLAPVSKIDDIFEEMTETALDLGFEKVLKHLNGRKLKVGTMCSGTESPILALELVAKSLKKHGLSLEIDQLFAAEIVAFKQAFIERNYGTKVIFRDIRDFSKPDAEVATTAYGAEVPIPGDLDLLVAGFSCVDFSMLNNKKKTIDAGGESGDTFKAIIDYCEKYRPKIVILENVCHAPWKKIEAEAWPAIGYAAVWQRVNTRDFFLPETRVRGYMMVVDARLHHDPTGMKHIPRPLKEVEKITAMWKENMDGLKRPASCPPEAFLLDADDQNLMRALEELAGDLRTRVVDWAACQGRHHDVRSLLGLGQGRPITQWVESGGCKPIDYMQKEFFRTQPDRVRDTADIWYLRGLLRGIDILHKTRHMDMSQNIDRDTDRKAAGLIGCITPNVIAFCSTRGAPLAGHELLALQGLPIYRLDLTREKQTQLRDLAGNAMTSTVVGAAILAALTAAYKTLPEADPEQMDEDTTPTAESIFAESDLETVDLSLTDYSPISATDAMTVARDSVKLCNCEGSLHKTDRPIQQCSLCRHTTCSKCGGNPTHEYSPLPAALLNERVWPNQVDTVLRRCLPLVITLEGVTDETINTLKAEYGDDIDNDEWARCINLVRVAVKSELRLQNIKRGGVWTVNYHSETAHLQLSLTPQSVQWNLYAKAAKDIPANHKLRKALANPIMRMSPDGGDITEGTWQFRLPKLHKILLSIRGCGELTPSFEARMGLAKFVDTEVCSEYEVSVPDDQKHLLDTDISGTYQLLPNCGMAWGSLHVRTSDLGSSKPLFFYMDPHRLGHPKDDCYVFSYDKRRLNYGEKRPIVTQIAPSWRETKYEKVIDESTGEVSYKREGSKQLLSWEDVCKSQSVHCQVPGRWIDLPDARFSQTRDKGLLHTETATTLVLSDSPDSCRTSHVVFRGLVSLPRPQLTPWAQGDWLEIAPIDYPEFFRAYGWATDKGGLLERLGDWIAGEESSCKVCSVCAPPAPRIEWKLEEKRLSKAEAAAAKKSRENSSEEDEYDEDAKPKKAVKAKKDDRKIIPIENPEGAARYERALKAQPKPFVVRINSDDASVEIALSINPQSLMHQAVAKFPDVDAQKLSVSYRLRTDYAAPPVADLPAFTIGDNKKDNQWEQPAGFNYPLRPEQLRSLGWMIAQERGTGKVFTEEETHEVHVPQIRWLAEGRAQREAYIRGGVLADQVGYGKTVTTLALIASQRFEDEMSAEEDVKGCIPIKATLILVPKQLPAQWNAEIKKFLARKSNYNVLVIKDLKTLEHTTINEFREADIIIATWALCEGDNYLFRIAQFAGMVEVAEKSTGRASAAWYQEARTAMAEHVEVLKSGDRDLKDLIDIRLAENREQAMQDVTFAPIKRLRGKAYVDAKAKKANGTAKAARPAADQLLPRPDVFGLEKLQKGKKYWTSTTCPLLEWFSFARVVVDEYTYVTGQEGQVIANIQARCRWILSATPPLEDFTDVKTLAKFLRIHLGVDDITPGVTKASNIKALEKDKTNTELFQTFRSSHSPAWHERRHGIAQSFLDDFVRRNIADIKAIEGSDHILPVRLPAEQRAIYLEIDNWLRMNEQMAKKGARHFGGNDRSRRIHDVIKGAESAGEPLLKCATTFSLGGHDEFGVKNAKSACDAVVKVRRKQVTDLVEDFKAKLRQAEWLHGICGGEVEKYVNWQSHVGLNVYGDRPTMEEIQRMVAEAKDERQDDHWHEFYVSAREKQIIDKKNAAAKAAKKKPKKKRSGSDLDSDEEYDSEGGVVRDNRRLKPEGFDPQNNMDAAVWELRLVTSDLNRYAQELVTRRRGLRFFERVRDSQRAYGELENGDSASKTFECSKCGEERSPDDVSFLCECGHLICTACLDNRETKGAFNCTAQGCNGVNMPYQIVPAAELGVQEHRNSKSEDHQGQKIEDIVALVKKIPDGEQVLLFAQFQDLMKKIAMAFRKEGIKHVAMHEKGDAASKLTEFQTNRDIRSMKKVLLLNIGDSSAAGSNLTNANHVIFVSPFLTDSDSLFTQAMTQAEGRARRYGQERHVHVYRFLSLKTIDVDIYQARNNGMVLSEHGAEDHEPVKKPFKGFKESGFALVREAEGIQNKWGSGDFALKILGVV